MNVPKIGGLSAVVFGLTVFVHGNALAHCDSLDGPVVKAAQRALDAGNPAEVLIWVQAGDEPDIRAAFENTLRVRVLSPQAKALADRYFFETVVRVHRAGEGASYDGLKPAGRDLGPAIPAADQALEQGSPAPVVALLTKSMEEGLRRHFEEVVATRTFRPGDASAGREYVKAYVEFIHYVERLYESVTTPAHGHVAEAETAETRH